MPVAAPYGAQTPAQLPAMYQYSQPLQVPGYGMPGRGSVGQPLVAPGRSQVFPDAGLLPGLFGADADPALAAPRTGLQAALTRNLSARYAVSKLFTAALGAVVAVAIGLLLTLVVQAIWSSAVNALVTGLANSPSVAPYAGIIQTLLTPNLLNLFAIEQHIPLVAHLSASGLGSATADMTVSPPLTGLILVPALALVAGGYVSASSDYQRRPLFSLARGALVGPFYAILLAIFMVFASTSTSGASLLESGSFTFGPSAAQALAYGVLWGVLFGALGGWIQLAGRDSLSGVLGVTQALAVRSRGAARLAGATIGAFVAVTMGVLIFLTLGIAAIAYFTTVSAQTVASSGLPVGTLGQADGATGELSLLLLLVVTIAPPAAIWAFALATGGPIGLNASVIGSQSANSSLSYGLYGAQVGPPNHWWFAIALIPAICYLAGGRVAARAAGATGPADGFLVGALMAVPTSILLALAAYLVSGEVDVNASAASILGQSGGELGGATVGPLVGGTFLAALLTSAVVGGLGGASASAIPGLGALPRLVLTPLRPFALALSPVLDRVTALPNGQARSPARAWAYDGILAAVGLALVVVALDVVNVVAANTATYHVYSVVDPWVAAAVIGVPLLFFIGSLVVAVASPVPSAVGLTAPPLVQIPYTASAPLALVAPGYGAVSAPLTPWQAAPNASRPLAGYPAGYPAAYPPPVSQPVYSQPLGAQPIYSQPLAAQPGSTYPVSAESPVPGFVPPLPRLAPPPGPGTGDPPLAEMGAGAWSPMAEPRADDPGPDAQPLAGDPGSTDPFGA